jgi:hypothetical protein
MPKSTIAVEVDPIRQPGVFGFTALPPAAG